MATLSRRRPFFGFAGAYSQAYYDFSGGLNTDAGPFLINENQARDCLNVHTSPSGELRKRNGFVTLNSDTSMTGTPCNLTGVHSLFASNTATKSLVAVGTTSTTDSIVKVTTGGVSSNLKTGRTANTRWEFAQAEIGSGSQGPVYGMNGNASDTPQQWDGSAASTSDFTASTGTVPNGKYIVFAGPRLWVAGVAANPSRLSYSGITGTSFDSRNWDANGYLDLEPNDGQAITGIGKIGPYLLVFKPRKTFLIFNLDSPSVRKLSSDTGCIAHRSIVETPGGTFFLSEDQGVMSTNGSTIRRMSSDITPTLRTVAVSPAQMALSAAFTRDYRYYLSVSTGNSRNDHILEYDLQTQSWWLHDSASNQFALSDPGGTPILYSASAGATARVDKAFVTGIFQDNGANYTGNSYFTGPYFTFGAPDVQKRVRQVRVQGIGSWDFSTAVDFHDSFENRDGEQWDFVADSGGTFGGSGTFGPTFDDGSKFGPVNNSYTDYRYFSPGVARGWSPRFRNTDANDWQLFSQSWAILPRQD